MLALIIPGLKMGGSPAAATPVFPDPSDVRAGITYGPTGADYTGTLSGGGGSFMRRR